MSELNKKNFWLFYPLGLKENFYKIVTPCAIPYRLKDYIVKKYVQKINIIDLEMLKWMHEVTKMDTIKNTFKRN